MIEEVMKAWIWPPGAQPVEIDAGLINHTVGVQVGGRLFMVLQRLNTDIFAPTVHQDIEAITTHLDARGVPTPRLVPTQLGELCHLDEEGGCWRLLTPVGNRTLHKITDPAQARSAGACVARFHRAVSDLDHEFAFTRPGAHDTDQHFSDLRLTLMMGRGHRLYSKVARLADTLIDGWDAWQGPTELPPRIIHGDLKISNVRFQDDQALALIDLDTLARGTLDIELGDAMRSWCNPSGEDVEEPTFDAGVFQAAMQGYAADADWTDQERAAIVPGVERICLELAARFARDAIEESYFGFDPAIGRGEHNLRRARGQAALARSVREQRASLEEVIGRL